MKALFIGGIKSGKSLLAEEYTLKYAKVKPYYLATTEFIDEEMNERIKVHKIQRAELFVTLEEPMELENILKQQEDIVLVECISMWINNMLYRKKTYEQIRSEIVQILELKQSIVFVLNDVGSGIIPENELARKYIDISGKISQIIAKECTEVFHVIAGIGTKIK